MTDQDFTTQTAPSEGPLFKSGETVDETGDERTDLPGFGPDTGAPAEPNPQSADETKLGNTTTVTGGEQVAASDGHDIDFGGSPAIPYYVRAQQTADARAQREEDQRDTEPEVSYEPVGPETTEPEPA